MSKKKGHKEKLRSLVRVACECGWFWLNDKLKGKSDLDLETELDENFTRHLREVD